MNNKYNKIAKKVGDGNYGHPTAIVEDKKILRRVGAIGTNLTKWDFVRLEKNFMNKKEKVGKNFKKILKKVGVVGFVIVLINDVLNSTKFTKWDFVKIGLRRIGVMGVVFAAVFLAVWAVMPASRAGGSINSKFKV